MLLLLAVLLTACRSDDKEEIVSPDEDCYLDIYVYAPSHPIVTRSDIGEVMPKDGESTINTLQIWVFRHSDDENAAAVGYLEADPTFLNETGQQKYQLLLEKSFANNPEPVDVYVVANTASVGLSFNEETSRLVLDNAKINEGYFGTGTTISGGITTGLQSTVPSEGLPMSAMAKNQPIYGSFPALRIGPTENETTVLELTRAVSKLRFVLCQIKDQVASKTLVSIDEIKLTDGKAQTPSCQIPTQTYLMPGTYNYSSLVTGEMVYINNDNKLSAANIPKVVNPLAYAYETQGAQEYEDLIDKAISGEKKANDDDEELMELGLSQCYKYSGWCPSAVCRFRAGTSGLTP